MALTPNLAAKPNGLDPKMARAWAKYFSKWIAGNRRNRRDHRIWRKRLRCPRSNVHHIDNAHISSITGVNSATMITNTIITTLCSLRREGHSDLGRDGAE